MKQIFILLSALLLTLTGTDVLAQKKDAANDYHLRKAYEVLNEERDEAKAMELLNRQLRETPDNVDALLLRVNLLRRKEDYAAALSDINHALQVNKPKKSGTPTSVLYWWKGHLYGDMAETRKASACFAEAWRLAQKDNYENLRDIAFDYAQSLYELDDLSGADAVYRRILADDETYQPAMVGLARNEIERGAYREALDLLAACEKLDASSSGTYRFRFYALRHLGEDTKAIDAGLDWFDKDNDAPMDSLIAAARKRPNYAEAQMKTRAKLSEEPTPWKLLLCRFYEQSHRYADAIRLYDELEADFGHDKRLNLYRSDNYASLGLYDRAIGDISKAMQKDPDWYLLCTRADYYRLAGDYASAIADFTAAIEEFPSLAYPYYKRGWCHELLGDKKAAMEDYNLGIDMEEDYAYLYLMRGTLLREQGNKAESDADFEKILQLDTVVRDGSCRQYALHFLGRDPEAEAWMAQIIATDPDDAGHYYDKACLFARMGKMEESVAALRTAFEKGYRGFAHVEHDDDMDPIRELPEFIALVAEYKALHEAYLRDLERVAPPAEDALTEIAFKRHSGGTFEIPCDINGLPLQMIFDTGASDVTISSVEANFMFKNGYLSDKDIKGKKYYQIANGEISAGTVITLREVRIGDAVLRNVDASVVKSQQAPLLLGQSAMERFGTITIDNINNKLVIKH